MMVERTYTQQAEELKQELLPGLKKHLRIIVSDFDASLETLLGAAIDHAEQATGCVFLPSTFTITHKGRSVDQGGFYPITDLIGATYNDTSITEGVNLGEGRIGYTALEEGNIVIEFSAGYNKLPDAVRAAIFLVAASLFNAPEDGVRSLPTASTNLLRPYRRWQK